MKKYTDINIAEAMKKAAQDEGGGLHDRTCHS